MRYKSSRAWRICDQDQGCSQIRQGERGMLSRKFVMADWQSLPIIYKTDRTNFSASGLLIKRKIKSTSLLIDKNMKSIL